MLKGKSTENCAGITISGDYEDFNALYDALFDVVGEEYEFEGYENVRLNVLGICYDIRHAYQGDREVILVDNFMDENIMKFQNIITPKHNVYYSFNTIWTEALFDVSALNKFIVMRAEKLAKKKYAYNLMRNQKVVYDKSIAMVMVFQSIIMNSLKEIVSEGIFSRIQKVVAGENTFYKYYSEYLNMINVKYLAMNKEKRLKNLSSLVKKVLERSEDYYDIAKTIRTFAEENNCSEEDVRLKDAQYPQEINW